MLVHQKVYYIRGMHPARGWEVEPGDIHNIS